MKKNRIIFHVDVNSAFLSWTAVEKLRKGEKIDIREIPSVIGGDEAARHGVVLAKSTPAKRYGIVTGESLYSARKKCPEVLIFSPSFSIYRESSAKLMKLLKEYTPLIEQYSIDECFMDLTLDIGGLSSMELAQLIKSRVKKELGFTVNIGISTNKVLAKMASELEKPDKINTLYEDEIETKLWPLPVGELFMVGRSAKEKLNKLFIRNIGELANFDVNILVSKFKSYGRLIWEYANGIDNSKVNSSDEVVKIISNSTTLSADITKLEEIKKVLVELCETVSSRLRKDGRCCTSVTVVIRTNNFKNYSHQKTFKNPTNSTKSIIEISNTIFVEMWRREPIRLLGVQLSGLCNGEVKQISIFDDNSDEKNAALDKAIDSIRQKYGVSSIKRLSTLKGKN
ncbi:Y-family DNA polymerase [Clostridium neuense]|uniref:DNA polymerase IV n=1 Tax=Clostridium neuense TaxID=1728934 RepID=A0ABW8TKN8_9CLOT